MSSEKFEMTEKSVKQRNSRHRSDTRFKSEKSDKTELYPFISVFEQFHIVTLEIDKTQKYYIGGLMWKTIQEASTHYGVVKRTIWRKIKIENLSVRKAPNPNGGKDLTLADFPDEDFADVEQVIKENDECNPINSDLETADIVDVQPVKTELVILSKSEKLPVVVNDELICKELQEIFDEPLSEDILKSIPADVDTRVEIIHPEWNVAREDDRRRAWAKFHILIAYKWYRTEQKARGIHKYDSNKMFVKLLLSGKVCIEHFNLLRMKKIEVATLNSWITKMNESGLFDSPISLLEGFRLCGRKSSLDNELNDWVRQLALDERCLDPGWIFLYLNDQLSFDDKVLPITEKRLQTLVRKHRKDVFGMSHMRGKETVRNKVKLHVRRINDLLPADLWESDGHLANVFVKSPFYCHRNPSQRFLVRPTIIVWLDIATGMIVGHRVCLKENMGAVKNSLMEAIGRYGVPKQIRVDNGSAYKNVDFAPHEFYKEALGKRKLTPAQKKAKQMLLDGKKGLYRDLGIDVHFTIPGNAESKSIEPFWNYCISKFEKSFPSWTGNTKEARPEFFKNIDSKSLALMHGDKFPTWDEFCERLEKYISYWNTKPRASLVTVDEEPLSPMEVYNKVEHYLPSQMLLESQMRNPYFEIRIVQRSMIEKNGILYWHPNFASLIGTKVGILYDEKNLREILICNDRGQIFTEKAIAINPGLQSGDNLDALIETNKRNNIGQLCYLALNTHQGAVRIEKMVNLACKELLPLSNTKLIEHQHDVIYGDFSFDEALDALVVPDDDDSDTALPQAVGSELSDEEIELREELKKDIAGMFG